MRRLRWLVVALCLPTAVAALPAGPAHACSCALSGPAEMLATHDAAFIGTVSGIRAGFADAVWTFEVDRWVRGDLGAVVDVHAAASGASCGFELARGQEAAVFVKLDGGSARGGLCSTLDAEALRAFVDPRGALSDRPAAVVVAGGSGREHLWLFDEDGGLVGAAADLGGERLADFALCPGGERAVELWADHVTVRDLATLASVHDIPLTGDVGRVFCTAGDGARVLAALRDEASGDLAALVALDDPEQPLVAGSWAAVEVVGEHVLATVGREHTELRAISLGTGEQRVLHRAADHTRAALNVAPAIEAFAVSPGGDRVAFEVTRYPALGPSSSTVFVYRVADAALLARATLPVEGAEVGWLDERSLLLTSYEHPPLILDADGLEVRHVLPEAAHWAAFSSGEGRLIGMDGPRLSAVALDRGDIRVLATVAAERSSWVLRLPRRLDVTAAQAPATDVPAAAENADQPATSTTSSRAWPVAAAGVLALLVVWALRRRA